MKQSHSKSNFFSIPSLFRGKKAKDLEITWSIEREELLKKAKNAITEGKLDLALKCLLQIDNPELESRTRLIAGRLADLNKKIRIAVISDSKAEVNRNKIARSLLNLVEKATASIHAEEEINVKIKEYLVERYENRLSQKLSGRQPINLNISPVTEGTTEETSSYFVTLKGDEVQSEIKNIFEKANGRLLVTGIPGAGKTVVMLQLVLSLLKEKRNAIPVLLNLATWQSSFVKLEVWLEKILPSEIGVNSTLAKKVLREIPLVLLLDGLDEVHEDDRKSCLEAIGRYGADSNVRFAIATRKQEYVEVQKDAPVYLQIEVQPLQIDQIKSELKRIGYKKPEFMPLLTAIETDEVLSEVVKTPIYFNVLQLHFAKGKRLSDLELSYGNQEDLQEEIIGKFVMENLKFVDWSKAKLWLSFLASRMSRGNIVVFELIDLQYGWWRWKRRTKIIISLVYGFVLGVFYGLFGGLVFGLFGSLTVGLFFGLFFGFVLGVFYGLVLDLFFGLDVEIFTVESVDWSWRNIRPRLLLGLAVGLFAVPFVEMFFSLVGGLFFGLAVVLSVIIYGNYSTFLQIRSPYQRFYASMKSLHFSILRHLHLRYLLYRRNLLPWKLVHFLNDMTKHHILESDGATWRFKHRIIQEYFEEIWNVEYLVKLEKRKSFISRQRS